MTRTVAIGAAVLLGVSASAWWIAGCGSVSCSDNLNCGQSGDGGDGSVTSGDGGSHVDAGGDALSAVDSPNDSSSVEAEAGCPAPTTLDCDGACVDPTQPANCGTCGHSCAGPDAGAGQATCTSGACGFGCDVDGSTPLICNGGCVDPTTTLNCGTCGYSCAGPDAGTGSPVCTISADGGGACSVTCNGSTTETCASGAGTSCFAPTDPNHCGTCSNACPAPPSGNGQAACPSPPTCAVTCNPNYHVCAADCLANADEPSDTADPCILTETFGVFASPAGSDTTGTGSRAQPYATVGHAMDQAKTSGLARVYACGTAGNFTENLVVGSSRSGVTVYGGLNCTTAPSAWTYSAGDKATVAPASGYALAVTIGVTFEDFAFMSAAATTAGSSSIAVFASGATGVVLERCNVQAGAGKSGQSQIQQGQAGAAPSGSPGNPPTVGPPEGGTGGAGGSNPSCSSVGGNGGSASAVSGTTTGGNGTPGPANGQTGAQCGSTTSPPTTVATGGPGTEGPGAQDWAAFTSTGWSPLGGQPGTSAGGAGQGGGGGGAVAVAGTLGGGGGGGAGGCGGSVGGPGTGGGSSIAVLLYDSAITLTTCTLTAAAAGSGGNGAPGQAGQPGGPGGTPGTGACGGGTGGSGGNGGGGGGGAGGVSAGVVWTGTTPTISGGTQTPGTAGAAGQNGDGTTTAKAGTAGGVVQFQ